MLKSVFTRVDLPRPDSPMDNVSNQGFSRGHTTSCPLTNNHDVEVEALSDTLAVPLIWQVGETNVTRQFSANNILVLDDAARSGCSSDVRSLLLLRSTQVDGRGGLASRRLRGGGSRGAVGC